MSKPKVEHLEIREILSVWCPKNKDHVFVADCRRCLSFRRINWPDLWNLSGKVLCGYKRDTFEEKIFGKSEVGKVE